MTDEVELARLARQYSKEAIAALVFAIRNSDDIRIKVTAALGILDRGFGRPPQAKLPVVDYSLDDLDRLIAYFEKKVAEQDGSLDPELAQTGVGEATPDAGAAPAAICIPETTPHAPEALPRGVGEVG